MKVDVSRSVVAIVACCGGVLCPQLLPGERVEAAADVACEEPVVMLTAEPGGRTSVAVKSRCRAGQIVSATYADATYIGKLSSDGESRFTVDCFAGASTPIKVTFEDGHSVARQPVTDDLSQYSKVAIIWTSSVNLDLHALELSAVRGQPGHVWAGASGSYAEVTAQGGGRGFMSTASTGETIGTHTEVYTFKHSPGQRSGIVKILVDYASRGDKADGDFCGEGRFAEVPFKAYVLERTGAVRRLDLAFSRLPCGEAISETSRFNSRLIPSLRVGGTHAP